MGPVSMKTTAVYFVLLLSGCNAMQRDLVLPAGRAEAVVAADLDGDGRDELISYTEGRLEWMGQSTPIEGRMVAADVGMRGSTEVALLAFGPSKANPRAPARAWLVSNDGIEAVDTAATRISDVQVLPQGLLITRALRDKRTETIQIGPAGSTVLSTTIMGLKARRIGRDQSIVVGRLYGDEPRSHGSLEIHRSDGSISRIPTIRGVRSLAVGDVDGDGQEDVVFSDGWHFKYGSQAQALIGYLSGPELSEVVRLDELKGNFAIDHIDIVRPGVIVASGTSDVAVLRRGDTGWSTTVVGPRPSLGLPTVASVEGGWFSSAPTHWIVSPGDPVTAQDIAL